MPAKEIDKNSISLAGEFAVLSQLSLRGIDANLTLGHTKGIDILAFDPKNKKNYQIEVKTNYQNSKNRPHESKLFGKIASAWIMNKKHETIISPNLFYCFVNIGKQTNDFKFYIVPSKIVAQYVKAQHNLWLSTKKKGENNAKTFITELRQFRIGYKKEKYILKTASVEQYENNWAFKGR